NGIAQGVFRRGGDGLVPVWSLENSSLRGRGRPRPVTLAFLNPSWVYLGSQSSASYVSNRLQRGRLVDKGMSVRERVGHFGKCGDGCEKFRKILVNVAGETIGYVTGQFRIFVG